MRKQNIVLISMLVLNLAQFNLWQYIRHDFFFKAETIQYLLAGSLIYSLLCWVESLVRTLLRCQAMNLNDGEKTLKGLYYGKLLTFLWIIFGMNDLCDLLFFNPHVFGWNEVVFTGLAFMYTTLKLKKQWKTNLRAS